MKKFEFFGASRATRQRHFKTSSTGDENDQPPEGVYLLIICNMLYTNMFGVRIIFWSGFIFILFLTFCILGAKRVKLQSFITKLA